MRKLSPVQIEIVKHIARGKTNKEIAMEMSYSEDGVKYQVKRILCKLDVKSRAHAVSAAIQHGLLRADVAGNRRLIVEGLWDFQHHSGASLYSELAQHIAQLRDEVARLADRVTDNDNPEAST